MSYVQVICFRVCQVLCQNDSVSFFFVFFFLNSALQNLSHLWINFIWAASSEKCLRGCAKCADSHHPCACARSHQGLCSPLIHSVVSNDSGSGPKALIRLLNLSKLLRRESVWGSHKSHPCTKWRIVYQLYPVSFIFVPRYNSSK